MLAIETSCDETSAAVVVNGTVRSNVVASQVRLHSEYGGVVPELATREHLRNILPVIRSALDQAGVMLSQVSVVAATQGPGLPAALLAGYTTAQAVAYSLNLPLLAIHHHEAHLYSPWIAGNPPRAAFERFEPNISLIVSGGHTLLVHVTDGLRHRVLGSTLDDAAGECFDKVAKLLALPFPGGPVLDEIAESGNAAAFEFPRSLLHEPHDNFSFSGLKTSVRYFLEKRPKLLGDATSLRDVCASVRAAIVDVLVGKTVRAARRMGVMCITASGGVSANRALRRQLAAECSRHRLRLHLADPAFCTDNAAMVGILAGQKWLAGEPPTPWDAETRPGWPLEQGANGEG
ncbi:MAG: tRNA (adenosine(37)-N6)-threonylcarbamoyltransferase complex transferase subunit TsaD [Pedosphaera sp.]|nr:tRNA (adenosine(37)-N6)-threonylcarbamoyltransferase complex transferase subunit TsaD [Pedosphaera sp.]